MPPFFFEENQFAPLSLKIPGIAASLHHEMVQFI